MIRLRLRVDADRSARSRLRFFKSSLRDLRFAWPAVNAAVESHHKRVFDTEGAANETYPGKWTPLHIYTVIAREQHLKVSEWNPYDYLSPSDEGPEGRILHWTYRLRGSVTSSSSYGGQFAIRRFTKRSFEFGSERPGARLHQDGGTNEFGRDLPKRPFLDPYGAARVAMPALAKAFDTLWNG